MLVASLLAPASVAVVYYCNRCSEASWRGRTADNIGSIYVVATQGL